MLQETSPKWELGVSVFFVVLSVVVFRETLNLPPGTFDPIGSAGFPRLISAVIGILSLVIVIRAVRKIIIESKAKVTVNNEIVAEHPAARSRYDLALGFYALSLAFAAALALRWIRFGITAAAFLTLSIGLLTRFRIRRLPLVILIALVVGFGSQYIFTRIFVVDLP